MSCPSVGSDGLFSLGRLPHLTVLDLSYTFLMNLEPVFDSCLQLKVPVIQLAYFYRLHVVHFNFVKFVPL
jgi:hypothetical protein